MWKERIETQIHPLPSFDTSIFLNPRLEKSLSFSLIFPGRFFRRSSIDDRLEAAASEGKCHLVKQRVFLRLPRPLADLSKRRLRRELRRNDSKISSDLFSSNRGKETMNGYIMNVYIYKEIACFFHAYPRGKEGDLNGTVLCERERLEAI